MAGLIYYISGIQAKPNDQVLKDNGLDGQVVGGFVATDIFLDGTKGTVFVLKGKYTDDVKIGFYYDEQTWTNIPKADGTKSNLWIGYDKNNKPKPKDFQKKDYIDGYYLELADNNKWIVPIARRYQQGCLLPKGTMMLMPDRLDEFVIEKYLKLQKIAEQLFVHFGLDDEKEFVKEDDFLSDNVSFYKTCAEVLNVNYNLDYREIGVLKLFTTDNTVEILRLVVDMPYIEKLIKNLNSDEKKTGNLDMSIG